jgi:hypothetical protein
VPVDVGQKLLECYDELGRGSKWTPRWTRRPWVSWNVNEDAIGGATARLGLRRLPLLPSQQTMHLMPKAAVAVYESAVENQRPED